MAKLSLSHVRFCYGQQGQCFRALDDLNIAIEECEFICILGHSGCGKTTLLRLLSGLQDPTKGTVLLDGRPMAGPGPDRAVVFQNYALFPWMSAKKNVQFGIRQARQELPKAEVAALAMEYLTKVDMADAADKYPYQLSGGMRQRVAIARALAMDADILLLDEPFGALDAKIRLELQQLLEQLWCSGEKRKTVIFVTHDIREAVQLASRILFMAPGKIIADIPVDLPRPRQQLLGEGAQMRKQLQDRLLQLFYDTDGTEATDEG